MVLPTSSAITFKTLRVTRVTKDTGIIKSIAALIGLADVALPTSSRLWTLSDAWRDAPADLRSLRDDLANTERFSVRWQR
ncbi:hypothetical protein B0H67DRAFT_562749 [Lasiosphaeris hirsuta]|uniref:Uncharacterized protein n=1 Tax=Lasiosphaeris hirsuta TaxID=260670 RepID=A0AA40EA56_9PEZI|nr:hypothetical protein B0H67DRAFT_562749 [Lasiosphaeris hirsuta]